MSEQKAKTIAKPAAPQTTDEKLLKIAKSAFKLGQSDKTGTAKLKEQVTSLKAKIAELKGSKGGNAGVTSAVEKLAKRVSLKAADPKSKADKKGLKKLVMSRLVEKDVESITDDDATRVCSYAMEVVAKIPPKPKVTKPKAK